MLFNTFLNNKIDIQRMKNQKIQHPIPLNSENFKDFFSKWVKKWVKSENLDLFMKIKK
jgi:hypothetical protein